MLLGAGHERGNLADIVGVGQIGTPLLSRGVLTSVVSPMGNA
jgi:hypothetical protein